MKFAGFDTIYGDEDGQRTPYMTRVWIGRLRLHIFHRGDADPDCHDHPWDFWTFPLTSYVEEVVDPDISALAQAASFAPVIRPDSPIITRNIVPAFRWSHRPSTHCHRVLGRYSGVYFTANGKMTDEAPADDTDWRVPLADSRKIITIVWRGRSGRRWGFLKLRDGRFCWVHWKEYIFRGGKTAPCDDSQEGV
ncbi:hypothetical protein PH562_18765 [Rhizobium sp. CNPSo 4062]|uniref:hypothetical protein n=1 Tax=Rhizobium sp. CNPSo 4062 TaxID=3021410 RepID=UPI00254ECF9B|nr:hypothetical protein [Rhizobium sp. CNPSo 4062]MDK4704302.1 hypothetical protein [Rhizobium sp. CNPSo 4062]